MPVPTTLDDPRLDLYRSLNKANLTRQSGRFICEGMLLVDRLLRSGLGIDSVVVCPDLLPQIAALAAPETLVLVLSRREIKELVGFDFHRGVLACGLRPAPRSLAAVLPATPARATVVVCPETNDPENLGSILRSAAALGVDGVLLGPRSADPWSRRIVRTSMGTVFRLPVVEARDLAAELQRLRELDFTLLATVLDDEAIPLPDAPRPARLAILFGNEAEGLPLELVGLCHHRVTLPMMRGTDSLNVSVAAGIFLYELQRERESG